MSYRKYVHRNGRHSNFCPFCGSGSYVAYTKLFPEGVFRRRKCKKCQGRWNTIEIMMEEEFLNDKGANPVDF